jgi:hypothetical protein
MIEQTMGKGIDLVVEGAWEVGGMRTMIRMMEGVGRSYVELVILL